MRADAPSENKVWHRFPFSNSTITARTSLLFIYISRMKDAWESITTDEHDTALLLFFAILQLKKHFNAFLVSPELRRPKLPSHPQLIYLSQFHSSRYIAVKILKCQWMKCSHWGMIRNFSRASRNPFEFKMEIIINSWFYIDFTFPWKRQSFLHMGKRLPNIFPPKREMDVVPKKKSNCTISLPFSQNNVLKFQSTESGGSAESWENCSKILRKNLGESQESENLTEILHARTNYELRSFFLKLMHQSF